LSAKFWYAVLDHIPDKFVVNSEIVVNKSIPHSRHGAPLDFWMLSPEGPWDFLGCLTNYRQATNKSALQRFVHGEAFVTKSRLLIDEIVYLDQDVTEVVTRLEEHPELPREFADR